MNRNTRLPAGDLYTGSPANAPAFPSRDYSVICVLSGSVGITADGGYAVYSRDGFLFLPPGQRAVMDSGSGARILVYRIRADFVHDHLNRVQLPVYSSELDPGMDLNRLRALFLSLSDQLRDDSSRAELNAYGILYLILAELESFPLPEYGAAASGRFRERTRGIAEYILLHYSEPLTLTELAGVFFLTPQYLSSFFRKHFGMNFKAYLTEQRLYHSLRDLRNSRMTISEIALRNGFSSISAYRRNFMNTYHIPPSDYRTRYLLEKEQSEAFHPAGDPGAGKMLSEDSALPVPKIPAESGAANDGSADTMNESAAGGILRGTVRFDAEIDAGSEPSRHAKVHRMINVGSAQNMMSERFRAKLSEFAKRADIRYVRVQGMISNSFIPMVLPHYQYYFRNADMLLTFLYENQLTPFIELTRLVLQTAVPGESQEIFVPRSSRFQKLLESFLLHVTRRWPESWLSEWKFELWMLPRDTPERYAEELRKMRALIRSYIPGAAVGGPGYHAGRSSFGLDAVVRALVPAGRQPDFFSVFLDCSDAPHAGDVPSISLDEDFPVHTAQRVRRALSDAGLEIPLYVTEWTSVKLPNAPVACSRYQAAFIAKTFFALDSVCDLAAYWLFCDVRQSGQQAEQNGLAVFGEGLLSTAFLPYASWYTWLFCAGFGSNVVSEDSCYRFAMIRPGHYQLIVWNYAHFRSGTEAEALDATDFDRIYTIFRETPVLQPFFRITGLSEGLFHVSRFFLGEFCGSLLDILIGEYTRSNIDKIDFLRNIQVLSGYENSFRLDACVPEERSCYTQVRETLEVTADLPPHTVCLWDIRRQI